MNSIIITAIISIAAIIIAAIVYKTIDNNSDTAFNNAIMNYEANDKQSSNKYRQNYDNLNAKYQQYVSDHGRDADKLSIIRSFCANTIGDISRSAGQKYSKTDIISYLTKIVKMS